MRFACLILAVLVVFGCARPDSAPTVPTAVPVDTSSYRTIAPPNTNYRIKIPVGWSTSTNPQDPNDTVAEFWPNDKARVYVTYQPELPGFSPTPEQLTEQIAVALRNEYQDAVIHEAGRIALANGESSKITFTTASLNEARGTIYTFTRFGFIYQVALIANETVWQQHLPETEAIAGSLTIA